MFTKFSTYYRCSLSLFLFSNFLFQFASGQSNHQATGERAPAASPRQSTYYVATNGNDTNDGRSVSSPFQSLAKINSLTLQPGDAVLFRRGDTFRGTLQLKQSGSTNAPIVVDAYGSGNKPVLAGSQVISSWSAIGNNIWQATCSACGSRVSGVYTNDVPLPLGRYPNQNTTNKGYLTVQSHSGKTQLNSQQTLSTNWTGGEAVIRTQKWIIDRATITQQNGNTLFLNNTSSYDLSDGGGFFIQNHPATLDQPGEWYYDGSAKTLQLYSLTNPNGQQITATAWDEAIRIENASYITIQNLTITQARTTNLYAVNVGNLSVLTSDITNAGEDAFVMDGAGANVLLESSTIYNVNNNGFTSSPYQNLTVRNNIARNIGVSPGRNRSGDGQGIGLLLHSTANTLIENNVVDSVGYSGISFSTNSTIQRNRVSNFCLAKSDGGGLYISNGNKQAMADVNIISNIVYNAIGAPEGLPADAYSGANGIYLDDCTQNAVVQGNTVFNCTGVGIFLHATTNIAMQGNTSFNNGEGQLFISSNHGLCLARTNQLRDNIFVSKPANQIVARYESDQDDLSSYGMLDFNYYARPFNDVSTISAVNKRGSTIVGADLALSEWQTRYQKDLNSKASPVTYKSSTVTGEGAVRLNNTFTTNRENWSDWSPYGNDQVVQVNGNANSPVKSDGGSLQVGFSRRSGHDDSYALAYTNVGGVGRSRNYRIQFDAYASGSGKWFQLFLRQRDGSLQDLSGRMNLTVGTTQQHYDFTVTATADEANTLLMFQVNEDGQTIWLDNVSVQEGGVSKLNNTFTNDTEGWAVWGPYGNAEAKLSGNTGQSDGGSLQVGFPQRSGHDDSYALVYNTIGAVSRSRSYRIQFDAYASGSGKWFQLFLRQRDGSLQDLSGRMNLTVGATQQHYDFTVTATADEANALLIFQVNEDGQTIWFDNISVQEGGVSKLNNTFTTSTEGWAVWGPYGNAEVSQSGNKGQASNDVQQASTSTSQLDGGSLQISFPSSSGHSDSYVLVYNTIGTVNATKSYRVRFDAVASGPNKRLQFYIRQPDSPWQDLSTRTTLLIGTTSQRYELVLTATADQANTIAIFQVDEDGQTIWLDNISVQEVSITPKNPDDYIQLVFNPTTQNSTVSLNGTYRDVKNQVYSGQIVLTPFTSAVLFKDEAGGRVAADSVLTTSSPTKPDFRIVYPIPTYDEFTFVADRDVQLLRVVDLLGRDRLQVSDVRQGVPLPFGGSLTTGQYLLLIQYADGSYRTEKLLKAER